MERGGARKDGGVKGKERECWESEKEGQERERRGRKRGTRYTKRGQREGEEEEGERGERWEGEERRESKSRVRIRAGQNGGTNDSALASWRSIMAKTCG